MFRIHSCLFLFCAISECSQPGEAGATGCMPLPKPKVLSRGICLWQERETRAESRANVHRASSACEMSKLRLRDGNNCATIIYDWGNRQNNFFKRGVYFEYT